MSNKPNGVLYIGCTDNLHARVIEHKNKVYKNAFTSRYNCDKLVYFEDYLNGQDASVRERQLKKWKREWKRNLINDQNPKWVDISINWTLSDNSVCKSIRINSVDKKDLSLLYNNKIRT